MSLKDRLIAYVRTLIPVQEVPAINVQGQPLNDIGRLNVDSLHAMIESAKGGDTRELFALYRDVIVADNHLQMDFAIRKLALLGDPFSVQPADKGNSDDVAAATAMKAALDACPGFLGACSHALDSILFPVAVVQKVFQPVGTHYELAALLPVDAQLLDFTTGTLRIRDVDANGMPLGTTQLPDLRRYIVHRGHLLTAPDVWGGPMRSILFWWLLGTMDRGWWAQFLDKYGSPFVVGKYPTGDKVSRNVLERAFQLAQKLGGLVVSSDTEVDLKQAATSDSGDAYEKFLGICQREKSKLVLGRTLGADTTKGSFGDGGQATNEREVRQDIRQFDARMLAQTLLDQLVSQYLRINGISGKVRLSWGGESNTEAASTASLLKDLKQAGLQPTDDALELIGERIGFGIERAAMPAPTLPFSSFPRGGQGDDLTALSAAAALSRIEAASTANDAIAREAAAPLARAFRGNFAGLRRIILESRSAAECEERARLFLHDYRPDQTAAILTDALTAFTANGATVHGDAPVSDISTAVPTAV